MIVAIVRFTLTEPISAEAARQLFSAGTQRYEGREDLKRKSYIRSFDGKVVGAVYFWRSLDEANAFYTDEWRGFVARKYGAAPSIELFESLHLIDNEHGAPQSA